MNRIEGYGTDASGLIPTIKVSHSERNAGSEAMGLSMAGRLPGLSLNGLLEGVHALWGDHAILASRMPHQPVILHQRKQVEVVLSLRREHNGAKFAQVFLFDELRVQVVHHPCPFGRRA